jgi:group II intron reverse transcriptase/maturase
MRDADTIMAIHQQRGSKELPLERVYRHLFNPELFLTAYGNIYRNVGAMTRGSTRETVDGMSLQRIHNIIGFLRMEKHVWSPVRRVEIPKANGKMRPLGIPTWTDKLVQEILRMLLEPYYEERFSNNSHGFRPKRGCHSALRQIRDTWTGTVWFVEGDIKGCFDNIDHTILLEILRRDIHDGRLLKLIENLLKAGYMEDWQYHETLGGTPQGGIISPLLSNIYMNELDRFVEDTMIPAYTKGECRKGNPEYARLCRLLRKARRRDDQETVERLVQERRKVMSVMPIDPDYRRLRYIRYADDFLLGFIGPKKEADDIRQQISDFLRDKLKLTLSLEKTVITHAVDDKAKFLGHEICVTREGTLLTENGRRATNGKIALLMPQKVVRKYLDRYSKEGKIIHQAVMLDDSVYTIIQCYQAVLRGVYNFYCMTTNVCRRMASIRRILELSLSKTLASKLRCKVTEIYAKYRKILVRPDDEEGWERKVLQVTIERPGKTPLTATFGGIPFERNPDGMGVVDFRFQIAWHSARNRRTEAVRSLLAGICQLCGAVGPVEMHHIRKLADIDRPGRKEKTVWEKIMIARRRKSLAACLDCHDRIHGGYYDGPKV